MHVQPLRQSHLLDVGQVQWRWRQVRQPFGQGEGSLGPPDAEQTHQALARRALGLFRPGELKRSVGVERLFPGTLQFVEVADLLHAPGQLGAGVSRLLHLPHVANGLFRRQRSEIGFARVGGQRQHVHRHAPLHLLEAARLHAADQRHGHQARQVEVQAALDLSLVAAARAAEAEAWVRQAPGLHHLGLGDADLLEIGLAARPVQILADPFLGGPFDSTEPTVGAEARAAPQHHRAGDKRQHAEAANAAPCGR